MRLSKFLSSALAGLVLLAGMVCIFILVYGKASAGQPGQPATGFIKPTQYKLQGQNLQITYSTTGFDGKPQFDYQAGQQTLHFAGDQIHSSASDIGTLVSVTIHRTVDSGSTSFTLLIPNVNLGDTKTAPLTTEGITIVHRFSVLKKANQGQTENYTFIPLTGTAALVAF